MSQNQKINEPKKDEATPVNPQEPVLEQAPKKETASDVVKAEARAAKQLKEQKRVWLTINSTENDSSKVMIGVNGHAYRINRDVPAFVPVAVVEALKLASQPKATTETLPNGQIKVTYKDVRRFSFTVENADAYPQPQA